MRAEKLTETIGQHFEGQQIFTNFLPAQTRSIFLGMFLTYCLRLIFNENKKEKEVCFRSFRKIFSVTVPFHLHKQIAREYNKTNRFLSERLAVASFCHKL